MRIVFFGDVVGRAGRDGLIEAIARIRKEWHLDAVIVNVDNAAGGFGATPEVGRDFIKAGADVLTGGDHIWDQKEIIPYIDKEKRLLRPANFPEKVPGKGSYMLETHSGKKLLVLHLLGQVFHKEYLDCPFAKADALLEGINLGTTVDAIFVDMHAEATSEKTAIGHYLDGRVSAVVGSHTHIPTADTTILPGGTAYQTDAGMCGDYVSVIGYEKAEPLKRFTSKLTKIRMTPASGKATLCGVAVDTDDTTGLAKTCRRIALRSGELPSWEAL